MENLDRPFSQGFPEPWNDAVESVVKWICSPLRGEQGDFKAGHLTGPAASGKSTLVPFEIHRRLSREMPKTLVLHATPGFKCAAVKEARKGPWFTSNAPEAVFGLAAETYGGLLLKLKKNPIPAADVEQPAGWKRGILPPSVVFVIDVDADLSAEFALALTASLTWATGSARKGTVRVLTVSSEAMHPFVSSLFGIHCVPSSFALPSVAEPRPIMCPSFTSIAQNVIGRVEKEGGSHTVVWFHQTDSPLWEGWKEIEVEDGLGTNYWKAKDDRRIIKLATQTNMAGRLSGSDYLHVVLGGRRDRVIWDKKSGHIVTATFHVNPSERRRQLAWADRTTLPRNKVFVYEVDGLRDPSGTHHADATSGQLASFLAGLARFDAWSCPENPSAGVAWVMRAIGLDTRVTQEAMRQLHQSRLLTFTGTSFLPKLKLQRPGLFLDLLPLARYKIESARFVAEPSASPAVAALKIQVAALIAVETWSLICLDEEIGPGDIIAGGIVTGITADMADTGVLWMALAVAKKAWRELKSSKGLVASHDLEPVLELLDGTLSVSAQAAKEMIDFASGMRDALVTSRVQAGDISLEAREGALSQDERENLYHDLIMAFSHQVTVVKRSNDRISIVDLVSRAEVDWDPIVDSFVDWDRVFDENGKHPVLGIYTGAIRSDAKKRLCICDWTWIPWKIATQWSRSIGFASTDELCYPVDVEENENEIERER